VESKQLWQLKNEASLAIVAGKMQLENAKGNAVKCCEMSTALAQL